MGRMLYESPRSPRTLARRWFWLIAAASTLAGCSFSEEETAAEQNVCMVDADCSTHHCEAGRCVAAAASPMQVTLVVTPKRTPSGAQPAPVVSEAFALAGGSHTLNLSLPISIPVRVKYDGMPIAATATFMPVDTSNRYTAKTTKVTVSASEKDGPEAGNNAMLLDATEYRVLIQPAEASMPPHSLSFIAEIGAALEFDYARIKPTTRKFVLHNAELANYKVRAVSEVTGLPISNMETFTGLLGINVVPLTFDAGEEDTAYKLELTPVSQGAYSTGVQGACGDEQPLPKITVPSRQFTADTNNSNKWHVELPDLHPAVEYSGVISMCGDEKQTTDLQVSLKTEDLYLASGDSEAIVGQYETAAAASWDDTTGRFRFCARVPPGTYTVVVTPSPGVKCEVFAEKRLLPPTWSGEPDELQLNRPAILSANVLTPDRMPMPKATIELQAVASSELMRAPNDRAVANYNRSSSVATGVNGSFSLAVDRGTYDVLIKPPETSNYPWRVIHDVAVASKEAEFATEIVLSEPVAVTGRLHYLNGSDADQASLAAAEVRAYTLVDVAGQAGEQRSVEIGAGHANEKGEIMLLLPATLQRSWNP